MEVLPGVYETLISQAIEEKLKIFQEKEYLVKKEKIDRSESFKMLADYLADVVAGILKDYFREKDDKQTISTQVDMVNKVLKYIEDEWSARGVCTHDELLSDESKHEFLRGIYSKVGYTDEQIKDKASRHPLSGYRVSNLFTGGNEYSMDEELRRDIETADNIDLLVSFIKFEGLRLLLDSLTEFVKREGTKLRVLTTTYMGATDPKAIARLLQLSEIGNVEIKASFNTQQERLHAKAYIFSRKNGFDTAYIGSSNLSRSALTKGLEWNMRITSIENSHIIQKTRASFNNYWNSDG